MSVSVIYFEPNGSPNLADWPSGNVPVTVRAYIENPAVGHTYNMVPRLIRGQSGTNFHVMYDTGTPETPPVGLAQSITSSWATYTFSVPVQALSGPTSDRLQLAIVTTRDDLGDNGGSEVVHIGSDGGTNQTKVETLFSDPPAVPAALERNPDSARPTETITTTLALATPQTLGTFNGHVGDPGLNVWPARVYTFRIWAKVTAGTAVITADLGRRNTGGTVVALATNVAVATVTSSTWTLFRAKVAVAETAGGLFGIYDVLQAVLKAVSTAGATLLVSVGMDYPSSLNAPLLPPAGGTVMAPADDGKVMTESDSPRWYLRDAVQSDDGSVVVTVDPTSEKLNLVGGGSGYVRPNCGTTVGAGWLFLPTGEYGHTDHVDWTATGDLNGINKRWGSDGSLIANRKEAMVYINNATPANPIIIRDGATPPSSDWLPLALAAVAGASKSLQCQ
jgi:hypothetical protein